MLRLPFWIVFGLVLLLSIVGCEEATPIASSLGGVSQETAAARAIESVSSSTPVSILAIQRSTLRDEVGTSQVTPPDTPVWAVTLSGTFEAGSCGPAGATDCPPPYSTARVLIDAMSGEFVLGSYPAPSPPEPTT